MLRGESHFFLENKNSGEKGSLFERIKKLGMPLAFLVTTGCHPSPVSPKNETPTSQETQGKTIEIPIRQNIYEEPAMDIFSSAPETEEARTYQSAAFKHLVTRLDYQKMKDKKIIFGEDIIDQRKENVSHLSPDSFSLPVYFFAHTLRPSLFFIPTGITKNETTTWNLDDALSKIQKEFGISDSNGIVNEETLHAIDKEWKVFEDASKVANQRWKNLCRDINIESRIKGTTGNSFLDALVVLKDRTYQESLMQKIPDHLRKYAAGEGNTFLYQRDESPFYLSIFSDKVSEHNLFMHELGHNIFAFGLQGGKNKKLNEKFPGGAYGDISEKGADLTPFFAAAFGGRKIPASYVDNDLSRGIIFRYEDSPMNEFDEISWNFLAAPKQAGLKGKYFISDGVEKTAKDGFVSGYAISNSMEDEAETFKTVFLYPDRVAKALELAGSDSDIAKKFVFMKKVLDKDTFTAWQEKYNF